MSPAPSLAAPPPLSREERAAALARCGAAGAALEALLAYCDNPYRAAIGGLGLALPLADEPHLEAWRRYAAEAASEGASVVLRRYFVQLAFPVRAGMSAEESYRAATRRGERPRNQPVLEFERPEEIRIGIHAGPAGAVPFVVVGARADFEALVRAFAGRNEPIDVPRAMGACLVKGLANWDRVARYRAAREAERGAPFGEIDWSEEMTRLAPRKELYQDRFLLLSSGPYSAVEAAELGLPGDEWRERSLALRREHEAFHYLTLRLFGSIRSNLLDELVADFAGLSAAFGDYPLRYARRFLGVDTFPEPRAGGRLEVYQGDPPLAAEARPALARLARAAAEGIHEAIAPHVHKVRDAADGSAFLLAAAGMALEELLMADREERFIARWESLRARLPEWLPRRDELRWRAPATVAAPWKAEAAFAAFAEANELGEDLRRDASLVLDELLSNVVKYGRREELVPELELTLHVPAGGGLELAVRDSGPAFDPLAAEAPATGAALEEREIGGLGLHLVRALAESVEYSRVDGRNVVACRFAAQP